MSIKKLASTKSVKKAVSRDPSIDRANEHSTQLTSPLRMVFDKIIKKQHVPSSDVSLLFEAMLDENNTTYEPEDTTLDEKMLNDVEKMLKDNKTDYPANDIRKALHYKFPVHSFFEKIREKRAEILEIITTKKFIDSLNADTDSLHRILFARTKTPSKRRNTIGGNKRTKNKRNKSQKNKKMKGGNFTHCNTLLIRLGLFFLSLSINMFTIEPIHQMIISSTNDIYILPIAILILLFFFTKMNTRITYIAGFMNNRILRDPVFETGIFNSHYLLVWWLAYTFTCVGIQVFRHAIYRGIDIVGPANAANLLNSYSVVNIIRILTDETHRERLCGIDPRYRDYLDIKCPLDNGNNTINEFECAICQNNFNEKEPLLDRGLPINFHQNTTNTVCNHIFHKKCIDSLIQSTHIDTVKCPTCRLEINRQVLSDTQPMTKDEFITCVCKE